ncbi:MAG: hypothetical protein H6706_04470 [Myxococcales bacterium]|nr:hypothetical protein [Myxococcales bacterium]
MLRLSLAVPFIVATMACTTPQPPSVAGRPEVLKVPVLENPDAIWVVRPVRMVRQNGARRHPSDLTHYGLFACYRSPTAAPPQCYLAEVAGQKAHLVWPDNPEAYELGSDRKAQ